MRRYGWIFQATLVAEHNKITLEETYNLPIIQFLNDLEYIKEFGKYKTEVAKGLK